MKKTLLLLSTLTMLNAQTGEEIFNKTCAGCHSLNMPQDMSAVVAPAVPGIMRHIKHKFNTKEEAVKFMADYIRDPKLEKSICMLQKIKRFGLMPSLKDVITQEEAITVSEWMYEQGSKRGCGNKNLGKERCLN